MTRLAFIILIGLNTIVAKDVVALNIIFAVQDALSAK
jgi:hypothetical protein